MCWIWLQLNKWPSSLVHLDAELLSRSQHPRSCAVQKLQKVGRRWKKGAQVLVLTQVPHILFARRWPSYGYFFLMEMQDQTHKHLVHFWAVDSTCWSKFWNRKTCLGSNVCVLGQWTIRTLLCGTLEMPDPAKRISCLNARSLISFIRYWSVITYSSVKFTYSAPRL